MVTRDTLIDLGYALLMFGVAALVFVVPDWSVGIPVFLLGLPPLVRAYRSQGWALVEMLFGVWFLLLGIMTLIAPVWGIPLLLITGGIGLVRALGELGVIIDIVLLALVAYVSNAPTWTVVVLFLAAGGKLVNLLREHLDGPVPGDTIIQ